MKVATWNVNSIRTRMQQVKEWLELNPIEVLCLQETKVIDEDFPKDAFEELGYNLYISGQKSYNGVAIFSKGELADVKTGFSPVVGEELADNFDLQKRVITAVVNGVRIVNLYVPNGSEIDSEKYKYKLHWLRILRQYLAKLLEESPRGMCVCGDFNIVLEDKDIYDPKGKEKHIMSSPLEKESLQQVLSIGLKDAFRKFNQEPGHFTWWDYRTGAFQRNRGWRIDHHYLTDNLYQQATSCTIDVEPRKVTKPSDHTPVIVEF